MKLSAYFPAFMIFLVLAACQEAGNDPVDRPDQGVTAQIDDPTPGIGNVEGIDVRICGYVTREEYRCIEPTLEQPIGRVWLRMLSDKPVINGKIHAVLYELLGDNRNQLAEHTFDVQDAWKFRTYMEFTNPGTFLVTLADPENGMFGETRVQIVDTAQVQNQ